jgi:hypothetical protein
MKRSTAGWINLPGVRDCGFRNRKVRHHEAGIAAGSLDKKQER